MKQCAGYIFWQLFFRNYITITAEERETKVKYFCLMITEHSFQ